MLCIPYIYSYHDNEIALTTIKTSIAAENSHLSKQLDQLPIATQKVNSHRKSR